jgi:predicted nucleotidyltransferase
MIYTIEELHEILGKNISLITRKTLDQERTKRRSPWFIKNVLAEMVKVYD